MNWEAAKHKLEKLQCSALQGGELLVELKAFHKELAPFSKNEGEAEAETAAIREKAKLVREHLSLKPIILAPRIDQKLHDFVNDLQGKTLTPNIFEEVGEYLQNYQEEAKNAKNTLEKVEKEVRQLEQLRDTLQKYWELLNILGKMTVP